MLCQPAQPFPGAGSGVVFAAYPVVVARLRQHLEQVGVGDLPLVRLVAIRHRGYLDVADGRSQLADETGEIPVHDLGVVEVELHPTLGLSISCTRARASSW